jgi:hypothetical protein
VRHVFLLSTALALASPPLEPLLHRLLPRASTTGIRVGRSLPAAHHLIMTPRVLLELTIPCPRATFFFPSPHCYHGHGRLAPTWPRCLFRRLLRWRHRCLSHRRHLACLPPHCLAVEDGEEEREREGAGFAY